MKKLALLILAIISLQGIVRAQGCEPNPYYNDSLPGIYPRHLPPLVYNEPYNVTLTVKSITDTVMDGQEYFVSAVRVLDLIGEPPGFHIVPAYTNLDSTNWTNNGFFPNFMSVQGCFTIWADTATVNAYINGGPNGDGVFPLQIYYDYLFRGNPIPATYVWSSTIGLPPYGSAFSMYSIIGTGASCSTGLDYQGNSTYYAGLPSYGGEYQVTLDSPDLNCGWTVIGNDCSWASITPQYGFGTATLSIEYLSNNGNAPRYCDFIVGTNQYFLTQLSDTCTVTLNIDTTFVGPLEGTIYITVDAADSCYWAILNRDLICDWVDVNPTSGQGPATIEISYSSNNSSLQRQCDIEFNSFNYTLKQQSPLSVSENAAGKLTLYPNPAADLVNINLPNSTNKTTLNIYDTAGQLVGTQQLQGSGLQQISTSGLANGFYLFVVQNVDSVIGRSMVAVNR